MLWAFFSKLHDFGGYYNYLNYTDLISFSELWKQSKQETLGWNLTINMIKW